MSNFCTTRQVEQNLELVRSQKKELQHLRAKLYVADQKCKQSDEEAQYLKQKHTEEIARLKKTYEEETILLKKEHDEEIARLKASYDKIISDIIGNCSQQPLGQKEKTMPPDGDTGSSSDLLDKVHRSFVMFDHSEAENSTPLPFPGSLDVVEHSESLEMAARGLEKMVPMLCSTPSQGLPVGQSKSADKECLDVPIGTPHSHAPKQNKDVPGMMPGSSADNLMTDATASSLLRAPPGFELHDNRSSKTWSTGDCEDRDHQAVIMMLDREAKEIGADDHNHETFSQSGGSEKTDLSKLVAAPTNAVKIQLKAQVMLSQYFNETFEYLSIAIERVKECKKKMGPQYVELGKKFEEHFEMPATKMIPVLEGINKRGNDGKHRLTGCPRRPLASQGTSIDLHGQEEDEDQLLQELLLFLKANQMDPEGWVQSGAFSNPAQKHLVKFIKDNGSWQQFGDKYCHAIEVGQHKNQQWMRIRNPETMPEEEEEEEDEDDDLQEEGEEEREEEEGEGGWQEVQRRRRHRGGRGRRRRDAEEAQAGGRRRRRRRLLNFHFQ